MNYYWLSERSLGGILLLRNSVKNRLNSWNDFRGHLNKFYWSKSQPSSVNQQNRSNSFEMAAVYKQIQTLVAYILIG